MEPSKNNFLLLQKSVILNGLEDKVTLYNVGIGKRREEARLYAFMSDHQKKVDKEWNFGAKMMYYNPAIHDPDVFETISLMPYDWFEQTLPKKIDLLKIDCEGAEEFIFYNTDRSDLSPLVKDRVTRFVGELHPGLNPSLDTEKLIDFLRKHFEIRVSENPTENTFFLIYGKKKS